MGLRRREKAILERDVREDPSEKVIFKLRAQLKRARTTENLGRGKNKCKGSAAGMGLTCSQNRERSEGLEQSGRVAGDERDRQWQDNSR